jgi:hypothetical protein
MDCPSVNMNNADGVMASALYAGDNGIYILLRVQDQHIRIPLRAMRSVMCALEFVNVNTRGSAR